MATIEHWNAYMNLLHEHALVEDDLRSYVNRHPGSMVAGFPSQVLFERFGVNL